MGGWISGSHSGVATVGDKTAVDAAATSDYLGAAGTDGALRVTTNHLTYTDGGNYVTIGLADHATARAALGLEIGVDVATYAHAMSTHSDEDTYNISTTGLATVTKGFVHGAETTATPSAAFTVDWTVKQVQRVTITGASLAATFTAPAGPARLLLVIVQGDGSDTINWAGVTVLWPGNVEPVLSTGSGDVDIISFYYDGTSYHGVANYDFS